MKNRVFLNLIFKEEKVMSIVFYSKKSVKGKSCRKGKNGKRKEVHPGPIILISTNAQKE